MEDELVVKGVPMLKTKSGPRDKNWPERVKEEYTALIEYIKVNQDDDNEWFEIAPNDDFTKWEGKCWYFYNYKKYEFRLQFEVHMYLNRYLLLTPTHRSNWNYLN